MSIIRQAKTFLILTLLALQSFQLLTLTIKFNLVVLYLLILLLLLDLLTLQLITNEGACP